MRAVLEFFTSLVELIKLWLRQRYGERREADRAAVRDDVGGEWVRSMGGTDRRDKPGAVVTDGWSYRYGGETFTEPGEWVHLPAGEAGNLLLWIKGVEAGS